MKNKAYFLFLLLILIIFTGCPYAYYGLPEWVREYGLQAHNLPEWTTEDFWGESLSEWADWQGASDFFKDLIPDNYNREGFSGEYRLITEGQYLGIEFSDNMAGNFLYIWIGNIDKKTGNYFIDLPQEDPNVYKISGRAKYKRTGPSIGQALITFTFLETTPTFSRFLYQLIINENVIIETEMKAFKKNYYPENIVPDWLPERFKSSEKELSSSLENIAYIFMTISSWEERPYIVRGFYCFSSNGAVKELGAKTNNALLYHGGIKEIEIDNDNKKILYQLLGGSPSDPVFVELHRNTEKTVIFKWLDQDKNSVKEETTWFHKDFL